MNAEQARIQALLRQQARFARAARYVDIAVQTELLADGYDLRALNKDLELEQQA
jgi:hypothetical protein